MPHVPAPAFAHSTGPHDARIALVGEAWGKDEEMVKLPFIGYSGQELNRMLQEVGIPRSACFMTNVLCLRPPDNNVDNLCASKKEVGADYPLKSLRQGKYLRPEFFGEIERLREELSTVRPNLIIAFGNIASWALLSTSGIGSIRGTTAESDLLPGMKVLPTYHPAAVLRNWAWRPIVLADLMKAKKEMEFPGIQRPRRRIVYNPSFEEIEEWMETYGFRSSCLGIDTETKQGQIGIVGFSSDAHNALTIPFINKDGKPHYNYWHDVASEVRARQYVQKLLASPIPKVFQNGLYDIQYFLRESYYLRNISDDTMLLHHALYPELPKGLGFLGSVYTNESSWKLLNRGRSDEPAKRDE